MPVLPLVDAEKVLKHGQDPDVKKNLRTLAPIQKNHSTAHKHKR
jgi:hypothetical protein